MGCLVLLLAIVSARLALVATWLFTDLLSDAFDSWLLPVIGFVLLPWTTLAYAWMWDSGREVQGFEWFLVVFAFVIDIGAHARATRRD